MRQLLRIRVGDNEFDPQQIQVDHIVHRIGAGAADADHRDARCKAGISLFLDRQVQGHAMGSPPGSGKE